VYVSLFKELLQIVTVKMMVNVYREKREPYEKNRICQKCDICASKCEEGHR
jgi:ferredoxin